MKFDTFIRRPVLSTVISIIIVILGLLGLMQLPVTQYPDIAPPTVQVSTSYTGADAQTILNSVIAPLEEQINGVENMTYMTSTASNTGTASITIYFKPGTDPDLAAVNVQIRVSKAQGLLPSEVIQVGVITSKRQTSILEVFTVYSSDDRYDQTFLQNYVQINLLPQVLRVNGVGDAAAWGSRDYAMRIWLRPDIMAKYGLIPSDITAALAQQNIEAAPGMFGENGDQSFQYTLKYRGRLEEPTEFENIIIRASENGEILRLRDIARIELGGLSYQIETNSDGHPGLAVAVFQTAGSNATQVINNVNAVLEEAQKDFPPGVKYEILINANDFLYASIHEVIKTLIEAFILVFIVVYIFLQDLRSTLIPAIAIPVALIGTFFFLLVIGFSLNLLTLCALILAIAIVVDDAIVVVEAVHAKLDKGYESALQAALDAMNEISGAIISITLVMMAVFIPVSFLGGTSGVFYKQFGITMAIAIAISALNALTLSPALCAIFLKPHTGEEKKKTGLIARFHAGFNHTYNKLLDKYKRGVVFLFGHKIWAFVALAIMGTLLFLLMKNTPTGLVPDEDTGTFFVTVDLPPATSLEETERVMEQIDSVLVSEPALLSRTRVVGMSLIAGNGSSYGTFICKLKEWDERKGKGEDVNSVIMRLYMKTQVINDARILIFSSPMIPGFSLTNGFEFDLQDRTGGDINKFYQVAQQFLAQLSQRPEITTAQTSFNPTFPQYMIDIDVARCMKMGVSPDDILTTLQGYYGGLYASNFNRFGKLYRVMIQADSHYRTNPESLNNIYVRVGNSMAPISQFITLKKVYGPQNINRFNLFTAIAVNGTPAEGYSSGDAIKAIQEVAAESLPSGYSFEFSGITRDEQSSGSNTGAIFILCILFIYLLLSAQYESYILPLAVILSVPFGLAGSFILAKIMGVNNNIYLQISLIMLIGLLAKNAILIVEFAIERRMAGMSLVWSAISGAEARLRPILMTSLALVIGLLPLMLSHGVGANGNKTLGTGAIGGMFFGMIFQIFVVPVFYIVFQYLQEKVKPIHPEMKKETGTMDKNKTESV
ncbi:MAG: efflux RND transporter permease subunit [Tannerellaceae bacterium]|nr:efflux RND transporter permease subunit [Tannerellaceae bacterium]